MRVAIAAWPWGAYLGAEGMEKGIRVKTSSFTRHHVNIHLTGAKACANYLNSILANQEATHDGYDEAMLLDPQGFVSEGSGENVFIVVDGELHTPDLSSGALKGITRDTIFAFARDLGLAVHERRITRDEVYCADEAFFTGTAAEVTPIRELDNRIIGTGSRGPVTARLQSLFFDTVNGRNPAKKVLAHQGRSMSDYACRGPRHRQAHGPAGVLPQSGDAVVVVASARVPRRRRSRRSDVPLLRHALRAGGRTVAGPLSLSGRHVARPVRHPPMMSHRKL